jgi:hypothetical protein
MNQSKSIDRSKYLVFAQYPPEGPDRFALFVLVRRKIKALSHAAFRLGGLCRFSTRRAHWNAGYSHFGGMLFNAPVKCR